MLKINIAGFVVGFLFVMHALGDFTAHADNQGKQGRLLMSGKHSLLTDEKELIDEISNTAGSRMIGLGGRKMAAKKVVLRNGEFTTITSTSSKNSGATCDSEARKGDLNVKCELDKRISAKKKLKVAHHGHDHFVAFGADYHGPARHPPKHN